MKTGPLGAHTRVPIGIATALFVAGCAGTPRFPTHAALTLAHGEGDAARVGTYVSSETGFVTSSYIIDGPEGLVVVDTQFLLSAAEELIAWAEATYRKKIVLAIVLHPNPDKFNGAAVFNRRGIRVITSAQVRAAMPAVHELRKTWFYEEYKPDYPAELPRVEAFGRTTTTIRAGGLALTLHVFGRGCSDAHVVLQWGGHLFPGDLVTNDFHAWLELGYVADWRARLAELQKLGAAYVHPGRGPSGDDGLLVQQAAYLGRVEQLVADAHPHGPPSPDALEKLQAQIEAAFPGHRYPLFVSNGLEALWARAAAQSAPVVDGQRTEASQAPNRQ